MKIKFYCTFFIAIGLLGFTLSAQSRDLITPWKIDSKVFITSPIPNHVNISEICLNAKLFLVENGEVIRTTNNPSFEVSVNSFCAPVHNIVVPGKSYPTAEIKAEDTHFSLNLFDETYVLFEMDSITLKVETRDSKGTLHSFEVRIPAYKIDENRFNQMVWVRSYKSEIHENFILEIEDLSIENIKVTSLK